MAYNNGGITCELYVKCVWVHNATASNAYHLVYVLMCILDKLAKKEVSPIIRTKELFSMFLKRMKRPLSL